MGEEDFKQVFLDSVAKADAGDYDGAIGGFSQVFDGTTGTRRAKAAFNVGYCWMKQGNPEGAMGWFGEWLGTPETKSDPQRPAVLEAFFEAWRQNTAIEASMFQDDGS
jgi:Tfp pilus assembly protein PilF